MSSFKHQEATPSPQLGRCGACGDTYPHSLLNEHHRQPQAAGGADGPVIAVCVLCHTAVHAATREFMRGKIGKARDILSLLVKGDAEAEQRLWDLVQDAARAIASGAHREEQPVTFDMSRDRYLLLQSIARGLLKPGGRKIGTRNLIRMIVDQWLEKYLRQALPEKSAPATPSGRPTLLKKTSG